MTLEEWYDIGHIGRQNDKKAKRQRGKHTKRQNNKNVQHFTFWLKQQMCSTAKAMRALNGENFKWTTMGMQKLWLIWYYFGLVLGVSFYSTISELEMLKYLLLERYWAHGFLSVDPFDVTINVNVNFNYM